MKILLTGGAGYIGSHTYLALAEAGFTPVILDDFSNSSPAVLTRLRQLTGQPVLCQQGSVADMPLVQSLHCTARHWRGGPLCGVQGGGGKRWPSRSNTMTTTCAA